MATTKKAIRRKHADKGPMAKAVATSIEGLSDSTAGDYRSIFGHLVAAVRRAGGPKVTVWHDELRPRHLRQGLQGLQDAGYKQSSLDRAHRIVRYSLAVMHTNGTLTTKRYTKLSKVVATKRARTVARPRKAHHLTIKVC